MSRYDIFNMIHKALRAMLYDTALTLQQTYFADERDAANAICRVEDVLYVFEQHALHEDSIILPAIGLYEPQLVLDFEKEHVTDHQLGENLAQLLSALVHASESEQKIRCGSALSRSFISFMVFNLGHMAKEEVLINGALWKHFTDEQLMLLNQKVVSAIPPAEKTLNAKWMIRGVNTVEAIRWHKAVKQSAPAVVFDALWRLTSVELPYHRRNQVTAGIFNNGAIAV